MNRRLEGRTALVIGAGAKGDGMGNGRATAILFARHGARVFAVDRDTDALEGTLSAIRAENGEVAGHVCDAADEAAVREMTGLCQRHYGRLDIVHHNIGINALGGPPELSVADWDRVMAVNVRSLFLAAKYSLPIMEQQGRGVLNAVSSTGSLRAARFEMAVYRASKAAVNELTREIAVHYGPKGIRANAIVPGQMDTPLILDYLIDAYGPGGIETMREARAQSVPLKRMGDAWDVAHAALFLASDEAKYVNGHLLVVDGGLTSTRRGG